MRLRYSLWLVLSLLLVNSTMVKSQSVKETSLVKVRIDRGWQFREAKKDAWYPATVPGSVHTDLVTNKLIDDPFYRDNEQKQQWIGKTDWEYR